VAVRFTVANEDSTVLNFEDTSIGDGDSEDVGGEVFEGCFAGTDGLAVDVPIDLPDFRGDLIKETGFFHFISELGFKDLGECFDREIEVDPGRVPEAIGGGEGAAGDDVMEMGVILEGSPPGVQDAEETGQISADEFFIRGEFLHRFGGGFEQGRVGYPLVLANESAQTLRGGKSEQEMVTGELPFHLFLQPLAALMVLTGGAMAIPAGAIDLMGLAAFFALIGSHSTGLGATGDDGIDGLAVCIGHYLGIAF
jgi:hypothetical protein